MATCLSAKQLMAAARSGAPLRFTVEYKRHVKAWMKENDRNCDALQIVDVEYVEVHRSRTRFISMDDPEHLEHYTSTYYHVRYKERGSGSFIWSNIDVTEDGYVSDRISQDKGPPVFMHTRRSRNDMNEKTFIAACPQCGRHGAIGAGTFTCCSKETLRILGTRRALEQYLESQKDD